MYIVCRINTKPFGGTDALMCALGECFWDPSDYNVLGVRLLGALEDGLAKEDKRFRRVTADGSPWRVCSSEYLEQMSTSLPLGFCNLTWRTAETDFESVQRVVREFATFRNDGLPHEV